jgi:hypothetical protein
MPFMTNGRRDYQKEKNWDHSHKGGKRIKDRAKRNAARTIMEKAGKVKKGDGKQIDHLNTLLSGGSNSRSNLRAVSAKTNLSREANRKKRNAGK